MGLKVNPSTFLTFVLVAGMLITGTINTLTKKIQNDTYNKTFNHPWFQTAVMFLGEFLCLIVFEIGRCYKNCQKKSQILEYPIAVNAQISVDFELEESKTWRSWFIFILPTFCDVLGTSFAGIGLLWVNASVWQMLRGSIIIFSGILSVLFLKRRLLPYRWLGMTVTVIGLGVVGISSFLDSTEDSGQIHLLAIGIAFILAGQFCNAIQMVMEESFVKSKGFPPLQIVGLEGFWGLVLMCLILLPAMYFIPFPLFHDDSVDAIEKTKNDNLLLAMMLLYIVSIAFYNFCGISVTKQLTAVHRTLVDASRTILVWVVDIIIFYFSSNKEYGESWTKHSYVQLIGFFILIVGTLIYNAVIKIPGLKYEPKEVPKPEKEPLLTKSSPESRDEEN
jgi:drug/metabolite transporter (DMT)-like permease